LRAEGIEESGTIYPEGTKIRYMGGKRFVFRPENFKDDEEDYEIYRQRVHADYKQRTLQMASGAHLEDYEDVFYWPYEALYKVDTEVSSVFATLVVPCALCS
jgi:hypothetical protein